MARPGFNRHLWFDMPFEEGVLIGWVGQFPCGIAPLSGLRQHAYSYGPRISKFYDLTDEQGLAIIKKFEDNNYVKQLMTSLSQRTGFYEWFDVANDELHFRACTSSLQQDIQLMKLNDISRVVTLTEHHHNHEKLMPHFKVDHIGIQDLGAPTFSQVEELSRIISEARSQKQKLAVHCLAGIGRTSTMLIAAHLLLGENIRDLEKLIAKQNPVFQLVGSQGEFIYSLARKLEQI